VCVIERVWYVCDSRECIMCVIGRALHTSLRVFVSVFVFWGVSVLERERAYARVRM